MYNIQYKNDMCLVTITGRIDENFSLSRLKLSDVGEITFDLNGLNFINSMGIRDWIKLIQGLAHVKLKFVLCPKVFIDQLNMVQGFVHNNSQVMSFYVPYFSEEDSTERNLLFTRGIEFDDSWVKPPLQVLSESGKEMKIDVIEKKYFKFITEKLKA